MENYKSLLSLKSLDFKNNFKKFNSFCFGRDMQAFKHKIDCIYLITSLCISMDIQTNWTVSLGR